MKTGGGSSGNGATGFSGAKPYNGGFPFSAQSQGSTPFQFSTGGFEPSNPNQIFEEFFSTMGGSMGGTFKHSTGGFEDEFGFGRPKSNQSVSRNLPLSLEELYSGVTKKLKVTRKTSSGSRDKVLSIEVKPGWKAGTKIKFPGEGDELPGGGAQDIEFIVEEKPHPIFERKGDDLLMSLKLSLLESLVGFSTQITSLDGKALQISNNKVVHPDQEIRMNGYGMPLSKTPKKRGSLIIRVQVQFPTKLKDSQKEALKNILS